MPSCATETDFISAMKTEEQSLVPGSLVALMIFEQRRDAGDSSRPASATRASWQGPEETPGLLPRQLGAVPGIADLERQWEMLMADAEARDLLTMRYDSASPHAALAQFREELDRMIVERTQTLERGAAASGPATRAPRSVAHSLRSLFSRSKTAKSRGEKQLQV
ncbi:TRIM11 [Symbiodinium microadriaticum]|nr:TRIM11 [Symbiodinium microadriaticum]